MVAGAGQDMNELTPLNKGGVAAGRLGKAMPLKSPFFQPSDPNRKPGASKATGMFNCVIRAYPSGVRIAFFGMILAISHVCAYILIFSSVGEDKENTSTIFGASSNMVNAIIGAGIVGIPFAIKVGHN